MARTKRNDDVWIVIPAYNEAGRIGDVLKVLKQHGYTNVLVVDDCSKDKTSVVAKQAGATVVRHKKNTGQGGALRTGIREAIKHGAAILVTFDADGQHPAEQIKELIAPVINGKADVALGSRFLGSAPGMPWDKRITLSGAKWMERLVLGVWLSDVHNGFRALSRKAGEQIRITRNGMAHASEIVYEIKRKKLRFVEVPVTIAYDEYTKAKGQSVLNAFPILWEMVKLRLDKH